MARAVVAAFAVTALWVGSASGDELPVPPADAPVEQPPVEAPTPPAPPPPVNPPPDPAWDSYDQAFVEAAGARGANTQTILARIVAEYPQHPAARRAGELIAGLAPDHENRIEADKVARGELVFWSTVSGFFVGANVCVVFDCATQRETVLAYTASLGAGLAVSVLASESVEQGEAQLYNSAQTWGAWTTIGINDGFASTKKQAVVALLGQGAGVAGAYGLWKTWRPTQGDVALANTFFLWSTVLAVWAHLAVDRQPVLRDVVLAGDAGILFGGLTSTKVTMSRGRTLLIDVGGMIGILGGGLIAINANTSQGAGAALLLATAAGLGIATAASNDWDVPVTVVPTQITGPASQAIGVAANLAF